MRKQDTYIARAVRAGDAERKSDKSCKMVLKSRQLLAVLLHNLIPEYQQCSLKDIAEKYISPEEIQDDAPVEAMEATSETVEGMNKESNEAGESTVYFDVKFRALLPDKTNAQIYLYFDIEAQNDYYPGYPLEKRAEYYLARMISSQLQNVSKDTNYNMLQKVYSIWICMGTRIPKSYLQTITRYSMKKEDVYGCVDIKKENYDLMTAYIIRLGEAKSEEQTIGMFQTLFTEDLPVEERLERLEKVYGIKRTRKFNEEVAQMCTYSQYMIDKGMEKGIEQSIKHIALAMLKDGEPYEKIQKFTKLTKDELKALEKIVKEE